MTALPPRQPSWCGRCGAQWYDAHTCPTVGSTTAPSPTHFRVPGPMIDSWLGTSRRFAVERDRWRAVADQLAHALDNIGDCDCDLLAPEHDGDCHIGLALAAYTELQSVEQSERTASHSPHSGPS